MESVGHKILKFLGNFMFPVVLIGSLAVTLYIQPPLISSPDIDKDFRDKGGRAGYFVDIKPTPAPWPKEMPPVLDKALRAAFGPEMPKTDTIYFFGTAESSYYGLPVTYGAETALDRLGNHSSSRVIGLFGFTIRQIRTGLHNGRAWYMVNGDAEKAANKKAAEADWLMKAALLLPLADETLTWNLTGQGAIQTRVEGLGDLIVRFSGDRPVSAQINQSKIEFYEPLAYGQVTLPSKWRGQWGQQNLVLFDLTGLVFNPPFAAKALAQPK